MVVTGQKALRVELPDPGMYDTNFFGSQSLQYELPSKKKKLQQVINPFTYHEVKENHCDKFVFVLSPRGLVLKTAIGGYTLQEYFNNSIDLSDSKKQNTN